MAETLTKLQGKNAVLFVRLLEDAAKMEAQLVPFQTSLSYDPSVDSDTTATKDGAVAAQSSVETDLEVEFINSNHFMADKLRHSLFNGKKVEMWVVNKDRIKTAADGSTEEVYATYMRGNTTEDSNDNDADDLSTRDVTFTVDGTPKDGWLSLSKDQQADFDYIFRGLSVAKAESDKAGGTDYDESKDGANQPTDSTTGATE